MSLKQILKASNAKEVSTLVNRMEGEFVPLGGSEENLAIVSAQANNPVSAIVEKLTNSMDAKLIQECVKNGIDPESPNAPKSMDEAMDLFDPKLDGITVEVSGDKKRPVISVVDDGCGQSHDQFESTFCSINGGHKGRIGFVQGVFHMGGTAALSFLGGDRYQLIASKTDGEDLVSWTLIRLHQLEEGSTKRNTWYEYLVDENGDIPRATVDHFEPGTLVKMFDFGLPHGTKGDATKGLADELSRKLFDSKFPFSVIENRGKRKSVTKKGTLQEIKKDEVENHVNFKLNDPNFGKVPVHVFVFNKGVERHKYVGNQALVFSNNGQVQGFKPRSFISEEVGFKMLRDSMLVFVDVTGMNNNGDLFSSSRDALRETEETSTLLSNLAISLAEDEILQESNKNRMLYRQESSDLDSLIDKLTEQIPKEKELMDLLKGLGNGVSGKAANSLTGGNNPSLSNKEAVLPFDSSSISKKSIQEGKSGRMKFKLPDEFAELKEGDVSFDLVSSRKESGEPTGDSNTKGESSNRTLPFSLKTKVTGDELSLSIATDNSSVEAGDIFTMEGNIKATGHRHIVEIKIAENKKSKKGSSKLPEPIQVFKDNWENLGWDGSDVVRVESSQDSIDRIYVNMDSNILINHLSKNKKEKDLAEAETQQYFVNMYAATLFLFPAMKQSILDAEEQVDKDVDEIVSSTMKTFSAFMNAFDTKQLIEDLEKVPA